MGMVISTMVLEFKEEMVLLIIITLSLALTFTVRTLHGVNINHNVSLEYKVMHVSRLKKIKLKDKDSLFIVRFTYNKH